MMKNLLLLHGALGTMDQLEPLRNLLASQYTIHSFNFEGHGGRKITGPYRVDAFMQDLEGYVRQRDLEGADAFGYSMGGYVALKLASRQIGLLHRIVTLGTKLEWNPETAENQIRMLDPEKIAEKVPKFAAHLEQLHAPLNWKEVVNGTAELMRDLGNRTALTEDEFRSIESEVLICIGDRDHMVSIEESARVAELLPNAQLKILEGVEHPIEKTDPKVLAEILL